MTETSIRSAVLVRTLHILQEYGWAPLWSTHDNAPMNIRSAVAKACRYVVTDADAHARWEAYLDAAHAIGHHLKEGITDWEANVKAPSEVEAMLTEVINRLEDRDIPARPSRTRLSGL